MFNLPYKMRYLMGNIILITAVFVLLIQIRLFAGIVGSVHDFSDTMRLRSTTHGIREVCTVCHTPHNGGTTEVPLWRGNLAQGDFPSDNPHYITPPYQLYSSDSLDATVNQPRAPSKACLTCHDGTISKGPVVNCRTCHYVPDYPPYSRNTNLTNDHPFSFIFDSALAQQDGALHDPVSTPVPSLGGKTIQRGMLFQNRLECPSCHDVHSTKGDSAGNQHLLLVDNKNDKLCLTCHNK